MTGQERLAGYSKHMTYLGLKDGDKPLQVSGSGWLIHFYLYLIIDTKVTQPVRHFNTDDIAIGRNNHDITKTFIQKLIGNLDFHRWFHLLQENLKVKFPSFFSRENCSR